MESVVPTHFSYERREWVYPVYEICPILDYVLLRLVYELDMDFRDSVQTLLKYENNWLVHR